jgi:hypothetical protein
MDAFIQKNDERPPIPYIKSDLDDKMIANIEKQREGTTGKRIATA